MTTLCLTFLSLVKKEKGLEWDAAFEGAEDRALANDERVSTKLRDCSLSVECDFDAGVARVMAALW